MQHLFADGRGHVMSVHRFTARRGGKNVDAMGGIMFRIVGEKITDLDECVEDIGVIELNEAFAAQALAVMKDLDLDPAKVNPNGGAIALGHPIGATGAAITTKILDEMERRDLSLGLVTLCIGGGQGIALLLGRE